MIACDLARLGLGVFYLLLVPGKKSDVTVSVVGIAEGKFQKIVGARGFDFPGPGGNDPSSPRGSTRSKSCCVFNCRDIVLFAIQLTLKGRFGRWKRYKKVRAQGVAAPVLNC